MAMSNEQYQRTQTQLLKAARMVARLDIEGLLKRIEMANTLGALVDPTAWMKAVDRMEVIERIARAALPLAKAARDGQQRLLDIACAEMEASDGEQVY